MSKKEQWIVRKKGFLKWAVVYISPTGRETEHMLKTSERSALAERDRLRGIYGSTCEQD